MTTIVSYGTSQYLFGVLVDPIARDLGWDKTSINGAYSLTVLVSGVLGFFIGRAVDRFGARIVMSCGSIVLALSLLLLARVQTIPEFYLLWGAGFGFGTALTYYPVSFTVVTNWFERRRMHALSTLTFMGAFSSTFFYPLNGALTAAFGWRGAVTLLGAIQLAITLPLHAIVIRRHPEDVGLQPDGGAPVAAETALESGVPLGAALRMPAFWLITAAIALSFFASTTVLVEHIAFLIGRGFPATLVTAVVGFFGVSYLPGRFVVASASRRVPLPWLIAGALALEGTGIAVLLAARDVVAIFAYVLVFGASYGALAPLRAAIMAERFGRRAYGAILAAQGIPIAVLAALGPFVGGRLTDLFGYAISFEICLGAIVLGIVAILIR